ncbi:histidine kinase N-terminal 7TM domain-containing diguanylate cyclase [Paenibacillus humicus]|uniref:histidine kinase N-terminal 7TM domain-containing diguanylate cyclase n=1 Tax=Paenibacillus humicus TaxID=412861 RepID=UPI003F5CC672
MEDNGFLSEWVKQLESWIWADFSLFVFMLGLFFYLFLHNPMTRLHKVYLLFHFSMMLWPLTQFAARTTDNPHFQLFYISASFSSLALQGAGWLVLTFFLTGQSYLLTRRASTALAVPVALTVIGILANPRGLFVRTGGDIWVQREYGPIFWILFAEIVLLCLLSMICIVKALRRGVTPRHRSQVGMALKGLLLFLAFGWADLLVNVVFSPYFPDIPGITSLGLALSALYFTTSIQRYRVFDIVRIAQKDIADSLAAGLIVIDAHDVVLECNRSMESYMAAKTGDRVDLAAFLRECGTDTAETEAFMAKYGSVIPERVQMELAIPGPDAVGMRHVLLDASPILSGTKELLGRVISMQDVTEIRYLVEEKNRQNEMLQLRNRELVQIQEELFKANLKLEQMATTDSLTGCYNRRFLMQRLEHEMAANIRYHIPFAVIMFDIDLFKQINDSYGHLIGDEVLFGTAEAVRGILRRSDLLARYGGEEFAIYLPHTNRQQAEKLAERLKETVESNRIETGTAGLYISITISVGVLSVEGRQTPSEARESAAYIRHLFEQADAALYEAKNNGRNCIVGRKLA